MDRGNVRTAGRKDLTAWIEQTVSELVLGAPENLLRDFDGQPIFGAPLVGVADGDDPLFETFRSVVGPDHLLPRVVLRHQSPADAAPVQVRVIAWALPFTQVIRRSNQGSGLPSRLYSLARCNGGALNHEVRRRLAEMLHEHGYAAVAPVLTEEYDAHRSPAHTFSSAWSERHVAYAAGLGQFGLNGCLITPLGASVRLGSVVTNLLIEPTRRTCEDHRALCLQTGGRACGRCIDRCPVGAISETGLDKSKCYGMRQTVRGRFLEAYTRTLHMLPAPVGGRASGYSLGCALCQCGVPCEGGFPRVYPGAKGRECLT